MLLESLPPEQRTAVYAGAFLLWRRAEEDWSPPPYTDPQGCGCARCVPAVKPHHGTEAARQAMHHRHRVHQRGRR
jgi:hypothetical protein